MTESTDPKGQAASKPSRGVAFIGEGATEKVFYREYLTTRASSLGLDVSRHEGDVDAEYRCGRVDSGCTVVMFHGAGSISSIPKTLGWFRGVCLGEWPRLGWDVFLCFDTDGHNDAITQYHLGDWIALRQGLCDLGANVFDLAADADIEDIMLIDLDGVRRYAGAPDDFVPVGRKGKSRMKHLFRAAGPGHAYHEGPRAKELIASLDMDRIREQAPASIDFDLVDRCVFGVGSGV